MRRKVEGTFLGTNEPFHLMIWTATKETETSHFMGIFFSAVGVDYCGEIKKGINFILQN